MYSTRINVNVMLNCLSSGVDNRCMSLNASDYVPSFKYLGLLNSVDACSVIMSLSRVLSAHVSHDHGNLFSYRRVPVSSGAD